MPRPWYPVVVGLLATVLLAGCTSTSSPAAAPSSTVVTSTASPASTAPPTPVSSGPTTAARVTTCPYVTQNFIHQKMGVRLGRITVLRSGRKTVGCRFYAQQHPDSQCGATCLAKEKLPGPNQPTVEITTQRYASSNDAHNAFVLRAGTPAGVTQVDFAGTTGLCFPTTFDPKDKGNDWACTVNKGPVMVLVRTVDTAHTTGTSQVLRTVLSAVTE